MAITLGELIYKLALEDGEFQSQLKANEAKMDAFAKKATAAGKTLTTKVTLPIVAAGAAAVAMAADFEVSSRKFSTAFSDAGEEAAAAVEKLNEEYGIAQSLSTQLLAYTGDLLKGFGATSEEALTLSESTNILAASLSAYNGVPVAEASKAITSALLGEREAVKGLGVVISEAAVQKQLVADGTAELTGQELLLAKAQATLTIAYEQSTDAVGSFSENTDTLSFQTQALMGDVKDLAVQFGTILLPIIKDVVGEVSEVIESFSELDDETKENILKAAAFAAAMGPIVLGVGSAAKAISSMSKAIRVLTAANPTILALSVSLAAVGAGIYVINNALEESAKIADINKRLQEGTASYADKISVVNTELERENALYLKQRESYNRNVGLAKENARQTLLATAVRIDGLNKTISAIEEERDAEQERIQAELDAEQELARVKAEERQKELEAENQRKIDQEALIQKYIDQNEKVQSILDSKKTELELIDDEIASITELSLKDGEFREDQQEAVALLEQEKKAIIAAEKDLEAEKYEAISELEDEWRIKLLDGYDAQIANLEAEKAAAIAAAEEIGASTVNIEQYYADEKIRINEELEAEKDQARQDELAAIKEQQELIINTTVGLVSDLGSLYSGITQVKLDSIDAELTADINAIDETLLSEEEYNNKVAALEQEAALKQYEIEKEAFETQKALDSTSTIISGALGAQKAYTSLAGIPIVGPALGIAAAAAAAVTTGIQVALINSQEPPAKPVFFADGGIVNPTNGGTHAIIGEAGDQEAVMPLNDEFYGKLASAAQGQYLGSNQSSNQSNGNVIVYNVLDGSIISKSVVDNINNRKYTIDSRSIRS